MTIIILILLGLMILGVFRLSIRVPDGKVAVIVRWGRITKTIGPGWHFKGLGKCFKIPTINLSFPGGDRFCEIPLHTKDGVPVKIQAVVFYKVTDPEIFVRNYMTGVKETIHDFDKCQHGQLLFTALTSAFRELVNPVEFGSLYSPGIQTDLVKDIMNRTMGSMGIEIVEIKVIRIIPPPEYLETALKIIEQKERIKYLHELAGVVGGDANKLLEMLYLTEPSSVSPDKDNPVKEKIIQQRSAEAEASAYQRLVELIGKEEADRLLKLGALKQSQGVFKKAEDFLEEKG
ncbi:MAG: SPFH domain-containing protein [candidate division WOR-3 bacterium]